MAPSSYQPDFTVECSLCDSRPCVVVVDHICPDTGLCGCCFFGDRLMIDWEEWNNQPEDTE